MTNKIKYNYDFDKNEYDFSNEVNGSVIDVTNLPMLVVCGFCNHEIEQEAIIINCRPYHYACSGIEL